MESPDPEEGLDPPRFALSTLTTHGDAPVLQQRTLTALPKRIRHPPIGHVHPSRIEVCMIQERTPDPLEVQIGRIFAVLREGSSFSSPFLFLQCPIGNRTYGEVGLASPSREEEAEKEDEEDDR